MTRWMAILSVSCLALMLLLTIADVIRRTFMGRSIEGVNELGEVMMVAIVFLGLGFAESRGAHVSMTLLARRLLPRGAAALQALGILLVACVVAWMLFVTADRAFQSYLAHEYRFGLVRIPIWPARTCIAVGLAAYLAELAFRLSDDLSITRDTNGIARAESPSDPPLGV